MSATILEGDCRETLRTLDAGSIHCCVTSPPYWGLRDYGHVEQIGLEQSPDDYVAQMVAVFEEVRRVLRDDGTLWLNIGDTYAASTRGSSGTGKNASNRGTHIDDRRGSIPPGLKPKDLVGIPWRVAFALQAAGWYLRSEIIWAKPNPMPESVRDRPTKAHEQVFLLAKSATYYYDADAIAEEYADARQGASGARSLPYSSGAGRLDTLGHEGRPGLGVKPLRDKRNARTVWTITPKPFAGAHFATMPPEIARRAILAGCPAGGVVLDPFLGSGTTGLVAESLGRSWIGCELNPEFAQIARERTAAARVQPSIFDVAS